MSADHGTGDQPRTASLAVGAPLSLAPLRVPDFRKQTTPQALVAVPACALFVARAQALRPEFRLSADNAAAVAEICIRLDGLPLAIELAAARSTLLSPTALLEYLDRRLDLSTGDQDRPARQRTLRDAIGWSYDLLEPTAQLAFMRLAVFSGRFTREGARRVCGLADLEQIVERLVEAALVQAHPDDDEPSMHMLETVRAFGLEQLATTGEWEAAQSCHAAYYLDLAERAERASGTSEQSRWLTHLDKEHENLIAALQTSTLSEDTETALRLAGALAWFWLARGYWTQGRTSLEVALRSRRPSTPRCAPKHFEPPRSLHVDRVTLSTRRPFSMMRCACAARSMIVRDWLAR